MGTECYWLQRSAWAPFRGRQRTSTCWSQLGVGLSWFHLSSLRLVIPASKTTSRLRHPPLDFTGRSHRREHPPAGEQIFGSAFRINNSLKHNAISCRFRAKLALLCNVVARQVALYAR